MHALTDTKIRAASATGKTRRFWDGAGLCPATSLASFGVHPSLIHTTFNIFMDVTVDPSEAVKGRTPRSRTDDWIELRAELDPLCGLTACFTEASNSGTLKPIDCLVRKPLSRAPG